MPFLPPNQQRQSTEFSYTGQFIWKRFIRQKLHLENHFKIEAKNGRCSVAPWHDELCVIDGRSYCEVSHNCFDFVLHFLRSFLHVFTTQIHDTRLEIHDWDSVTTKDRFWFTFIAALSELLSKKCIFCILPSITRVVKIWGRQSWSQKIWAKY